MEIGIEIGIGILALSKSLVSLALSKSIYKFRFRTRWVINSCDIRLPWDFEEERPAAQKVAR